MHQTQKELEYFLEGIALYNSNQAYESHEAWEHVWLKSTGKKKLFLQILILLAAVRVHREKARFDTAKRVLLTIGKKLQELGPCHLFHLDEQDLKFLHQSLIEDKIEEIKECKDGGS